MGGRSAAYLRSSLPQPWHDELEFVMVGPESMRDSMRDYLLNPLLNRMDTMDLILPCFRRDPTRSTFGFEIFSEFT